MTMWMVRAEREGAAFGYFVEQKVVGVGWHEIGDVRKLPDRDAILAALKVAFPQRRPQYHLNSAGSLHRFTHQMQRGDFAITYDPERRIYAVGECSDQTLYAPDAPLGVVNQRRVEWRTTSLSRDSLSAAARNSLGSMLTQFRLSEEVEADVLRAIDGRPLEPEEDKAASTDSANDDLLDDIESRSIEFIKDSVVQLNWEDMQELVAGILRAMNYKTRVSPKGADQGKDIIASPDGFGFEEPRIVVEVKHRPDTSIGAPDIRGFLGGRHARDKGLYVSTGGFTKDALYEAERANIPLALMTLDTLVATLLEHYEDLDVETRSLVPLTKVYWPLP